MTKTPIGRPVAVAAAALSLAALAACTALTERSSPVNGARLFRQDCAGCHGADARGLGAAPDLTRLAARAGGTFPAIDVLTQIHSGGGPMPAVGARDLGPTVVVEMEEGFGTPVQADLLALWSYLETIQRGAPRSPLAAAPPAR